MLAALVAFNLVAGCNRSEETSKDVGPGSVPPMAPAAPNPGFGDGPPPTTPETSDSRLSLAERLRSPAFSPDGRWLACIQEGGEVTPFALLVFDAKSGARRSQQPLSRELRGELLWTAKDRLVVWSTFAQVWKVDQRGHLTPIVTYDEPERLHIRTEPAYSERIPPGAPPTPGVPPVAGTAKGKPTYTIQATTVSSVHQLGVRVLTQRESGDAARSIQLLEVFDTKKDKPVRRLNPPSYKPTNHETFQFSPTKPARLLVGEYPAEYSLKFSLWEPRSGRRLWQQTVSGFNVDLDWTPDGQFLIASQVTGSHGRELYPPHETLQFDAHTGRLVRKLPTQTTVKAAAVSDAMLMTYGVERRPEKKQMWGSLQLTDLRTGQRVVKCWVPTFVSHSAEFTISRDGQFIVACNWEDLWLWRVADLKQGRGAYKTIYTVQ